MAREVCCIREPAVPKLAKSSSYYSFFIQNNFYISEAMKAVLAQMQIYLQLRSTEVLSYCSVS